MATYWENSCSFGLRYISWYKCLIVSLVFSHLGFWSGNLFLIAPFPDLCLLVPLNVYPVKIMYHCFTDFASEFSGINTFPTDVNTDSDNELGNHVYLVTLKNGKTTSRTKCPVNKLASKTTGKPQKLLCNPLPK